MKILSNSGFGIGSKNLSTKESSVIESRISARQSHNQERFYRISNSLALLRSEYESALTKAIGLDKLEQLKKFKNEFSYANRVIADGPKISKGSIEKAKADQKKKVDLFLKKLSIDKKSIATITTDYLRKARAVASDDGFFLNQKSPFPSAKERLYKSRLKESEILPNFTPPTRLDLCANLVTFNPPYWGWEYDYFYSSSRGRVNIYEWDRLLDNTTGLLGSQFNYNVLNSEAKEQLFGQYHTANLIYYTVPADGKIAINTYYEFISGFDNISLLDQTGWFDDGVGDVHHITSAIVDICKIDTVEPLQFESIETLQPFLLTQGSCTSTDDDAHLRNDSLLPVGYIPTVSFVSFNEYKKGDIVVLSVGVNTIIGAVSDYFDVIAKTANVWMLKGVWVWSE